MQFYSGAHPSDIDWLKTELVRLGIDADIQATSSTARSFIEFERDGRLARVVSIETDWELSHSLFADQPSVFSGVTDIVIDARYPSACLSLAKNVRESSTASATIWLDPGSTAFNSEERTRAIVSILPLVDVLVATTDFLNQADLVSAQDTRRTVSIVFETLEDGCVKAFGPFGKLLVRPVHLSPGRSSFGAGDIFRGRLLAHLLNPANYYDTF